MGRAAKEQLNRVLTEHLNTIHETFQALDQAPAASLAKVSWNEVIKMGDQVSKQATTVGMLCTGETPEVKALEEKMGAYFNILQGFLLLSYGSTVGAGPTLSSSIHGSVKQVVDCSFMLLKECVSSYGSTGKDQNLSIPQLVGTVWDACSALKKTPSTNIMAIGRAVIQVAVSIKDVLREMNELKPAASDPSDEIDENSPTNAQNKVDDGDNSCEDDLGNDLSPEEMRIAQLSIGVVSETLVVVKELIRSITGLAKQENTDSSSSGSLVTCLEKLLKLCQGIGAQVDELGACLYPPQEIPVMKAASEKICSLIDELQVEVENLKGSSESFVKACIGLRDSLKELESEFGCTADLVPEMQNLVLDC